MSTPVPPSWKDLGKPASDLLGKDYPTNKTLEVKTKAPNNIVFTVNGLLDNKTGAILGDLQSKYSNPKLGLTITPSWSTKNLIKAQVELENQLAKGLKFDVLGSIKPSEGEQPHEKTASVTAIYKQPALHTRLNANVFAGPVFTADAVVGRDGFLVGGEGTYNLADGKVKSYNAAVGYNAPEYSVTLHGLKNFSTFSASYYHRVNRDLEAGARATYNPKAAKSGAPVHLEVGAKTFLDNAAFVKAKINNEGLLHLGYTQALRPGVKFSWGLGIDTQKLGAQSGTGGHPHTVGYHISFEG
jgi:voltage-dependent anion channel protein 2